MRYGRWARSVFTLALSLPLFAACSLDELTEPTPEPTSEDGGSPYVPEDGGGSPAADASIPDAHVDGGAPQFDAGDAEAGDASSKTITLHVTAAAGGTLTDPSGTTTLVIPPGALAADTDITLTVLPKSGAAVVDVSDFGPDGLQFSTPATLTIKADASLAPSGKTLAVALFDGTDFTAISGSTYAAGAATVKISHFSKYSVVVIDGDVVVVPPSSCEDVKTKFVACGGDLAGTWVFKDFCVDAEPIGSSPECPTLTGTIDFDMNGREIVFDGTKATSPAGTLTATTTVNYPRSCIGGEACSVLEPTFEKGCVEDPAGICRCANESQEPMEAVDDPYTLSGNTFVMDGKANEYCVDGTRMIVKAPPSDPDDDVSFWILERK